jgi:hypothetical protein
LTAGALGIISCVEYKIFSEIYQSGGRMKPAPVKPNVTIDDLQIMMDYSGRGKLQYQFLSSLFPNVEGFID